MDDDATAGELPLLETVAEAAGLAAAEEPDALGWLPEEAHPATAAAQISAPAPKSNRPDPESPDRESLILDSPFLEYPVLGLLALANLVPANTAVPFGRAAPHAPSGHYDDNAARVVGSGCPTAGRSATGLPGDGTVGYRAAGDWAPGDSAVGEVSNGMVWVTGAVTHLWWMAS